jgi:uncharacterized protein (DUF362 family)
MSRVVVVTAHEYEQSLPRVLDELALSGGSLRGLKVFIKPNWVSPSPENLITSPVLVNRLVELVKDLGAGQVFVGENPTIGLTSKSLYEQMGIRESIARRGGKLVLLDEEPHSVVRVETDYFRGELALPRAVLESDYLIDVPVAKTHGQAVLSLGIKNLIGLLPDQAKERNHLEDLHGKAVAILQVTPPRLTVIDGMVAGEGQGPAWCDKVEWNTLIAGENVVAVDAVAAACMGYDPMEIPAIRIAQAEGFGPADLAEIEIGGDGIKAVQKNFKRAIASPVGRYSVPVILSGCCEGCIAWMQVRFDPWEKEGIFKALKKDNDPVLLAGCRLSPRQIPRNTGGKRLLLAFGDCVPPAIREQPDVIHFPGCPPAGNIKKIQEMILEKYLGAQNLAGK